MFNSKKRVKDMSAPGALPGAAGAVASPAAGVTGALPSFGPTSAGNIQKLEMAKRLALKINAQKNLGAEAQVSQTGLIFRLLHLFVAGRLFFSSYRTKNIKRVCCFRAGRDAAGHQRHPAGRHHHDTLCVSQDYRRAAGRKDQRQAELHPRGEAGGRATGS